MAVLPPNSLPVGYRFRPTDQELINHYLKNKINGNNDAVSGIGEVDLCKKEPWDLPVMSLIETNDGEWFFFCPIDRKYRNGQRSNRATAAGYWKATGRDRSIKAVRGSTVIGKKKTLVFYIGRAPNGRKTNWVIHEYHPISEELDGTNLGQGSFVLCKLMEKNKTVEGKQDHENAEGSNREESEQNDASPATIQSSSVDVESEPATPIMSGAQDENLPSGGVSILPPRFDITTPGAHLPTESPNGSCIADDVLSKSIVEPDSELEDLYRILFPDTSMEPPDVLGKVFPPSHSQMQVELGSSDDFQYPAANEVDNDENGLQVLHDIDELLDSIIDLDDYDCDIDETDGGVPNYISPSESTFVKDNVFNELDAKVAKAQHNESKAPVPVPMYTIEYRSSDISNEENLSRLGLLKNESLGRDFANVASTSDQSVGLFSNPEACSDNSNAVGSSQVSGTGIKLRSRQSSNKPRAESCELQGNARRRIRLQQYCGGLGHLSYNEGNQEANILAKVGEAEENLSTIIDETQEISISTSNYVNEGAVEQGSDVIPTYPEFLDCYNVYHEANYALANKVGEAEEKHSAIIDETQDSTSNYVNEGRVEQGSDMIPTSSFPTRLKKPVPSVPLVAPPPPLRLIPSMHMLSVLVVVGLSIALWAYGVA